MGLPILHHTTQSQARLWCILCRQENDSMKINATCAQHLSLRHPRLVTGQD